MDNNGKNRRGLLTVATGDELYFRMAVQLLRSYRQFSSDPLPFAILTDRRNDYTEEFDDAVLLPTVTGTYLDKLEMFDCLPYEVNLFIDADCLAYGDLNEFFRYFENADDFSCFGRVLPLDDRTGWFEYEHLGPLKSQVDYVVGLHGGVYYMRKTEECRRVFTKAKQFAENYGDYRFKGRFTKPGDEPVIALSMAVNHCRPIPFPPDAMTVFWEHERDMRLNMKNGSAVIRSTGQKVRLLHWGTRFCTSPLYQKQIAQLEWLRTNGKPVELLLSNFRYDLIRARDFAENIRKRVWNKLRRIMTT